MRRVERELRALPITPPAPPQPIEAIRRRGRVLRRRRRAATSIALTTVIAAVAAIPLVALRDSRENPLVIADGGDAGSPPEIIAVTRTLDLVAFGDGKERVIAKLDRFDNFERPIDVAPDRSFVYVTEGIGDPVTCESRIVRFPLEDRSGVAEEIVERGDTPAISPDGRRLAYIERSERPDDKPGCVDTLVVRDLATGDDRRWVDPSEPSQTPQGSLLPVRLHGVLWSPDGRTLGFTRSSATGDFAFIFDTATQASVLPATELRRPDDNVGWILVGWTPSGEVVVRSTCKGPRDQCSGHDAAVLEVNRSTGDTRVITDLPDEVTSVWLAPGGDQVIYVVGDGRHGSLGTLYRRSLGGEAVEVARDILAATWARGTQAVPPSSIPSTSTSLPPPSTALPQPTDPARRVRASVADAIRAFVVRGDTVWLLTDQLVALDADTMEVRATTNVREEAVGLAVSSDGVWVLSQRADGSPYVVMLMDASSLSVLRQVELPQRAYGFTNPGAHIAATPGAAWVGIGSALDRVDSATGEVTQFALPIHAYRFAVDDTSLWVGAFGQPKVVRVDLATGAELRTVTIEPGGFTWSIATDENAAWITANYLDPGAAQPTLHLVRIDNATYETQEFVVPAIGVAAGDGEVWIQTEFGTAGEFDPSTGAILRTVELAGDTPLDNPQFAGQTLAISDGSVFTGIERVTP